MSLQEVRERLNKIKCFCSNMIQNIDEGFLSDCDEIEAVIYDVFMAAFTLQDDFAKFINREGD